MAERVRVLHDLPFVVPGGEEVLVAGTVLDTIPKTKGGVLAVWRGKIRFLRVGEDVEFVGPQGRR